MDALLGSDTELDAQATEEAALDRVLDRAAAIEVSSNLRARLISDFDAFVERRSQRLAARIAVAIAAGKDFVWPGAPWWKPAFALSLSLFLGLSAGLLVLDPLTDRDGGDQVTASLIGASQAADLEQDD